jgi:hypothetical protein
MELILLPNVFLGYSTLAGSIFSGDFSGDFFGDTEYSFLTGSASQSIWPSSSSLFESSLSTTSGFRAF